MLWRFTFLAEEKDVTRILQAIAGKALELQVPQPVLNAKSVEATPDKPHRKYARRPLKVAIGPGGPRAMFAQDLITRGVRHFGHLEMGEFLQKIGQSPTSSYHHIKHMVDEGLASRTEEKGKYLVTPKTVTHQGAE